MALTALSGLLLVCSVVIREKEKMNIVILDWDAANPNAKRISLEMELDTETFSFDEAMALADRIVEAAKRSQEYARATATQCGRIAIRCYEETEILSYCHLAPNHVGTEHTFEDE